jgi:hypothetical protein
VQVTNDGGVAGSMATSTSCSLTYKIADTSGTQIKNPDGSDATGLTPDVPRYSNCKYDIPTAGSPGIAYRDGSWVWHLLWAVREKPTGATVNPPTTLGYDSGTFQWQYKATSCLVLDKANEDSSWTPFVTGEKCS